MRSSSGSRQAKHGGGERPADGTQYHTSSHYDKAHLHGGGPHGDRLQIPARGRRPQNPDRLRAVPGAQRTAAAQLGAAADRSVGDLGGRCSRTRISITPATCRGSWPTGITAACIARRAPPTCAGWCSPTRRGCRKRRRARPTGCTTRSTTRRCRCTASRTRFARCRNCSRWRSTSRLSLVDGVDIEFIHAGHLLGSAFVRMTIKGGPTVLFGGDLGRYSRPVLPDPSAPPQADVLLLESTYGDRDSRTRRSGRAARGDHQGHGRARAAS